MIEDDYCPSFQDLEMLVEMGFTTKTAMEALKKTKNVNEAATMMLEKKNNANKGVENMSKHIDLALERTFQDLIKKEDDIEIL